MGVMEDPGLVYLNTFDRLILLNGTFKEFWSTVVGGNPDRIDCPLADTSQYGVEIED